MKPRSLTLACAATLILLMAGSARATTWCGNQCADGDDGIHCTDWEPGAEGQTCKAKAICSSTCTTWWTVQSPTVDALAITQDQAKRLPGARTYGGSRPANR